MIRSRLLPIHQPLFQRTVVTQAKNVVSSDSKRSEEPQTIREDNPTVSYAPPRRPLKQQFTHQVLNQVPPLEKVDLYETDLALKEFVTDENCGQIKKMGAELGAYHWFEQGHIANRYTPTLHQFDRFGHRIDEVQFHPAYHDLMAIGMRYGVSI